VKFSVSICGSKAAILSSVAIVSLGVSSSAQAQAARQLSPCEKITVACESAGFVVGGAGAGKGLYQDCVAPLMQGQARPPSAKPLPIIDPQLKAACVAVQPNFGAPASAPLAEERALTYVATAPAVFMTQQEMRGYKFQWGPSDGTFGAISLGNGQYRFFGTGAGGQVCPPAARNVGSHPFTGTLDRVTGGNGCYVVLGKGDGPPGWLFDADYAGGGNLIRLAGHGQHGWLMSFRGEYHWKNPANTQGLCGATGIGPFGGGVPCYYSTLGLAFMPDGAGKFRVAGESVQLSDPLSASKGGSDNRNIGYGSLVVADEHGKHLPNPPPDLKNAYIYVFFVSSGKDLPGFCAIGAQCPGVARALYEDVVSAVLSGNPNAVATLFRKYHTGSPDPWSQPATGGSPDLSVGGGTFTPLYNASGSDVVIYDRAFDVYLSPVPVNISQARRGISIRSSKDLIHWSDPIGPPITDGNRALSYVNLLGETGDPDIAGVEPRLYFHSTVEGKSNIEDSAFKVVKLTLSRN
jgi:hypothetical protein